MRWLGQERSIDLVELLSRYRQFLARPGRTLLLSHAEVPACPSCGLDDVAAVRDGIAEIHRTLPPASRAALSAVLRPLDADFRRRTLPDPAPVHVGLDWRGRPYGWWWRRLYDDA